MRYRQSMHFRARRVFTRRAMKMADTESVIDPALPPGTALINAVAIGICVIKSGCRLRFFPFGILRKLSHFN